MFRRQHGAHLHPRSDIDCSAPQTLQPAEGLVPASDPPSEAEKSSQEPASHGIDTATPDTLQPANGLVPDSNTPSDTKSKSPASSPASSAELPAAKGTTQTESQKATSNGIGSATPDTLQPADGLTPEPNTPSEAETKSSPAPEFQAATDTKQTDPQEADTAGTGSSGTGSSGTGSSETGSSGTGSPEPNTQQTESQKAEVQQNESPETDSQQAPSQQTGGQQTDTKQTETQPSTADVAAAPINPPIVVQGQTVPADGGTITVDNQPVKISSGYVHVGTSSAPIPVAQVTPAHVEPIVAGTLTFQPATPSPVSQVAPSPFVVGGLTFSAAQSEPSSGSSNESSNESKTSPDQSQDRPVVVGGKTYAPQQTNSPQQTDSNSGSSNAAGNSPMQGGSKSSGIESDLKPIVIGGTTYTPVTATPTPAPQQAAVFSFGGTAFTQGGSAVMISGTRYSLGPSGVVVGTSSIPFATTAPTTSLLTVGSQTLTALPGSASGFSIDHSTLLPGSPAVVINGTTYSLNRAGSLIAGTSTIALATAGSRNANSGALTAGGETFTPLGGTAVVVDGTTISVGGAAITDHGTRLSLASNGLLVGSSTFAYATPAANTAVSTGSGTFGTGVSPNGVATLSTYPSATGGVGTSAALGKDLTLKKMMVMVGISGCLSIMMGMV